MVTACLASRGNSKFRNHSVNYDICIAEFLFLTCLGYYVNNGTRACSTC